MSNSNSSKQVLLSVIGIAIVIVTIVGVAFAFFNYTRTGTSNTIRVGRISFVSKNEETITLNNLFPIDPSNTSDMNDNTKVGTYSIDIKGDTDYVDGIEYLVSAVDANIYTSEGQIVPITLDFTVTDLGDPSTNYFTARESTNASIYKKLVGDILVGDQMLLVGFIKPNTTSGTAEGVDGNITIKAYLNKNKILISDTYDGTESDNMGTTNNQAEGKTVLTTAEWNALNSTGVSFKVKVEANEGIWVNGSLEEIMKQENFDTNKNRGILDNESSEFVSASTGINFGAISSYTNGKGVYMRAGTENDAYPIVYYRGAVDNNNVVFANKCWKAVRTTDTGGVKLIYNGELQTITTYEHSDLISDSDITYTNDSTYPYTYDGTAKTWTSTNHTDDTTGTITFTVKETGNYRINYEVSSDEEWDYAKFYKNDTLLKEVSGENSGVVDLEQLATSDVIKVEYTKDDYANSSAGNDNVIFSVVKQYGNQTQTISCANTGTDTYINLSGTNMFAFNTSYNSPAYVGYMYGDGDVYTFNSGEATSGAYFGSSFTWDGTNYKLVDAVTTKNNTHHYTCNLGAADGTCTTLRYYYNQNYYVNLTGGDGIEQAMTKMQTNTNDSNAKDKIDTWYLANMTSYTNKLEDTIWCNDRSVGDNNNNGWIANGGDLSTYLYYGARERSNYASNTSTVKNQPSLACTNKNDRFTVSNADGNGALTYPVAMLTNDEIVLAGGLEGTTYASFYLNNGSIYWSMSPYSFSYAYAYGFNVFSYGYLGGNRVGNYYGLRPAVSLKPGMPVVKGTGTASDPFVIE